MESRPGARSRSSRLPIGTGDVSVQERADHIAEWVRLTAEKVAHGAPPLHGGVQPKEQETKDPALKARLRSRSDGAAYRQTSKSNWTLMWTMRLASLSSLIRSAHDTRGPMLITMPASSRSVGLIARTSARVTRAGLTEGCVISRRPRQ